MAVSHAFVQKRAVSFARAAPCRFAAAVAWPRARFATAFAPLIDILINGFFFVHGFDMTLTFVLAPAIRASFQTCASVTLPS